MFAKRLSERPAIRAIRTAAYVAFGVAGLIITITTGVYPLSYVVMGWFLIVGSPLCALGAATGRWGGEYIGLPLVTSAMATFAGLTWHDNGWHYGGPSILLLAAIAAFLFARLVDVRAVGRAARRTQRGPSHH